MSGAARWRTAIGAVALALVVLPAPAMARLRWSGCGDVEAECARVPVPLDRSGAVKGSVPLRIARYTRAEPTSRRCSTSPAGPAERACASSPTSCSRSGPLERRYQLVSYDQRGTGYSGLIRCRALERDPRLRSTRAGARARRSWARGGGSTAPTTRSRMSRRCGRRWACRS